MSFQRYNPFFRKGGIAKAHFRYAGDSGHTRAAYATDFSKTAGSANPSPDGRTGPI